MPTLPMRSRAVFLFPSGILYSTNVAEIPVTPFVNGSLERVLGFL